MGLAQIGEFSFILGVLGQRLGILPAAGMDILVAAAIVSIAVNPLLFRAAGGARGAARRGRCRCAGRRRASRRRPRRRPGRPWCSPASASSGVASFSAAPQRACRSRSSTPIPTRSRELRGRGLAVVRGDPAEPEVLRAAGIADAKMIVVTNPLLADKMRICMAARQVNPRIAIVATSGSGAERAWLHEFGAAFVCDAIDEMTESLVRTVRGAL